MPERVRVVVDGRALTDSSSFRGIGTWTRNLIEGLALRPELELAVLCSRDAELPPGVERIRTLRVMPGRWRDREHEVLLPLDLARSRADVCFFPATDAPRRCASPWVQTVLDLWPVLSTSTGPEVRAFEKQAARFRKATAVVAISEWSAQSAVDNLGLDPARMHVVRCGVAKAFQPAAGSADPPYLLFVGEYDPRKRHDHAFAAIGALADAGFPHRLIVTGRVAPWFADVVQGLVAASPHPERITLAGHVSFEELVRLYQGASAVLVTSEAEGFGLPAVEAMASGTPVVAYDNSATAENVRGAGVLVPDGDLPAFVAALTRVLTDDRERDDLVRRGLERAAQYGWEKSVEELAQVLVQAAGA